MRTNGNRLALLVGGRSVSALRAGAPAAVVLLRACTGREMIAPNIAVGEDSAYWCEALRLAAKIVAAQRFLPGLTTDPIHRAHRALWEPVLGDRERALASALAAVMPKACRAMSTGKGRSPADPGAALERFLAFAVDALVRLRLRRRFAQTAPCRCTTVG